MLLLFRMGDFYELFDQDAETAHKLLGLTLTTRDRTLVMAGFPHHQLEVYLHKLLKEGQAAKAGRRRRKPEPGPLRRQSSHRRILRWRQRQATQGETQ
jgi:DNA mismatch repair protein MutS